MVVAIRGFECSWEPYKKYKVIYTECKNDKRDQENSGSDIHQKWKWFEQLDVSISTDAYIKNQILACAAEVDDENNEDKTSSELQDHEVTLKQEKKKKKFHDNLEVISEKVVFLTIFHEIMALLKNMDRHMAAILGKW